MQHIHDNKPAVFGGQDSLYIDLIFWHPNDKNALALTRILESHGLGERSQTVEWLDKITVRVAMWKRHYLPALNPEEWNQASQELAAFIRETAAHYHVTKIEFDTRAFSVGLAKKVRRETHQIEDVANAHPVHNQVAWWILHP
ncbi:MAG: hypothetical protein M0Z53_14000 [Thermaerobacter sp.]|nr:hypothetical protein [Thermaerobacter sp.]